jgi:hypothetical protein
MVMTNRLQVLVLGLVALFVGACGKPAATSDADLGKAERVARYLTSTRFLKQTAWRDVKEKGSPSELVSFVFSDLAVAAWPPGEDSDPREQEEARAIGVPMFPKNAALVHARVDPRLHKQLVLSGDDAKGQIVAEFYLEPGQGSVGTARWEMPKGE